MPGRRENTALGVARARFTDSLPRRSKEVKAALKLLVASPSAERPRESLRRRLQSILASAQVFRITALAEAIRHSVTMLDTARSEHRPLSKQELEELGRLATSLPELGGLEPIPESAPSTAGPYESLDLSDADTDTEPSGTGPVTRFASKSPTNKKAVVPPASSDAQAASGSDAAPQAKYQIPTPRRSARPPKGKSTSHSGSPAPQDAAPKLRASDGGIAAASPSSSVGTTAAPAQEVSRVPTTPGGHASPLDAVVVSVVLLGGAANEASVRQVLAKDRFELHVARDAEEALRLSRTIAPDIVLAEASLALPQEGQGGPDADFLSRLRADVLTDFVPVLVLFGATASVDNVALREAGATEGIRAPLQPEQLSRAIARLTDLGTSRDFGGLGTMTPMEVAQRLAEEIHHGLVDGIDRGAGVAVPLGDGTEILAAAWSAIARVRSHLSDRSSGRVHFKDPAGRRGPALVSLSGEEVAVGQDGEVEVELTGRRILLVDDDPAVLWFFAELLGEAGAMVVQAEDGLEALNAARTQAPDVILTDIMMPRMDGLSLCRALDRDPALSEIPVILLSWKEDFLARMRELRAGASGYLRKEAGTGQILEKVREVLRPRALLESRLRAGGEVRGRVEGLGLTALLRTVAAVRPDSRLSVRDAWGLIEVEFRGGEVVDVTSTATDGGYARADRALRQLVGVTAGRYSVVSADAAARSSLHAPPKKSVEESVARLAAVMEAVSADHLSKVESLMLDEDSLESFERASPDEVGSVVRRLREGVGPRKMLLDGEVSPAALETTLHGLARRDAIRGALDAEGEDLIAAAVERRPGGDALAEQQRADVQAVRDEAAAEEQERIDREESVEWLEDIKSQSERPPPPEPVLLVAPAPAPATETSPGAVVGLPIESSPDVPGAAQPEDVGAAEPVALITPAAAEPLALKRPNAPPRPSGSLVDERPARRPVKQPDASDLPTTGGSLISWTLALLVLAILGYLAYRLAERVEPVIEQESRAETTVRPEGREEGVRPEGDPPGQPTAEGDLDPSRPTTPGAGETPDNESFGELQEGTTGSVVAVPDGHGVLQIIGGGADTAVRVGGRAVGAPPLQVTLPEGRHEVTYRTGEQPMRYRYYFIRAGHTRVVTTP